MITFVKEKQKDMEKFTTVLIVILTLVLGRYLILQEGVLWNSCRNIYSAIFISVFTYGVYNILKNLSKKE